MACAFIIRMYKLHSMIKMIFRKLKTKSQVHYRIQLDYVNWDLTVIPEKNWFEHTKKEMSHLMGKPTICRGENKDADQLCSNRESDQHLCFRYSESKSLSFLNPKFQASSCLLWLYSPFVSDLFKNYIVGFLMRRLKCAMRKVMWLPTDQVLQSRSVLLTVLVAILFYF